MKILVSLTALALCLCVTGCGAGAKRAPLMKSKREVEVKMRTAKGNFDVKMIPQSDEGVGDPSVGRMSLDKQFHGDLEATGRGQMLAAMTDVKGSAGYVAMERVSGKLGGRSGSFVLQHSGTMNRGTPLLLISVVPDSGTEDLAGISGNMTIDASDGKHAYSFEYRLPDFD